MRRSVSSGEDTSVAERYALGCAGLLITAGIVGFGVIIVGWLFGIGLRLSGL